MDRRDWWATVHEVAESDTTERLSTQVNNVSEIFGENKVLSQITIILYSSNFNYETTKYAQWHILQYSFILTNCNRRKNKSPPINFIFLNLFLHFISVHSLVIFFSSASFKNIYMYLFISGCTGSSLRHSDFLYTQQVGCITDRCGAEATLWWLALLRSMGSRSSGFSSCSVWAQQFWHRSFVAQRHVGSSWTRDKICIPWTDRQILNHWTTWEVHFYSLCACRS